MSLQKNALAVWLFNQIMQFSVWLQHLPSKITPLPFRLLQIGSAFWQSRVLYVATRLDIATLLANETLTVEQLAERVSVQPVPLYRLLRMLVAMGIFVEPTPRCFKNNPLSCFLREDNPQNIRSMILMHNSAEMSRPWYEQLERGIQTGEVPFKLTHGAELFSFMDQHAEFDALFARAMDQVEILAGDAFATDFDWGRFTRLLDIGGANGSKARTILQRHPQIQAIVIDRPQIIQVAAGNWEKEADVALRSRLRFQAGNLFDSIPQAQSNKDIYFLSAILHGFDDRSCIRILKNIATASRPGGGYIAIMEIVVNETPADFLSASFDMQMLMGTAGGERTLREWQNLFDQSGVVLEEVVGLRSFGKILLLRATS